MSVVKLEQDIKLLEEKLEEINTTVSDPIERNEYKKELQRKIKKLNRNKKSLELLQQEHQEIESLRQEISSVKPSDEVSLVNQNPKNSLELQQKNNIGKELNYQDELEFDEIDSRLFDLNVNEEVKSDLSSSPSSNDSAKMIKTFAICSVLFTLTFLGLRYTKQLSVSSSNMLFTQDKATKVVKRWYESKKKVFAPPYDRDLAGELLTGKSYERTVTVKDDNPSPIDWLQDNNKYYTFQLQNIDDVIQFQVEDNKASIDLIVTEQRTFCYENSKGEIEISDDGNTISDTSLERYYFSKVQEEWKIADHQTLERIERTTNNSKSCILNY